MLSAILAMLRRPVVPRVRRPRPGPVALGRQGPIVHTGLGTQLRDHTLLRPSSRPTNPVDRSDTTGVPFHAPAYGYRARQGETFTKPTGKSKGLYK